MPAVSPEKTEAKNGLGLDHLAHIRGIQAGDQFNSITHLVDERSTSEPCERARPMKHTVPPLLQLNQRHRLN
jgi:hypothetical protein